MPSGDRAGRAVAEVRALHAFFAAWFRGLPQETADFARFEAALAPDFRLIGPDGAVQERDAVIARVRALRASAAPDFAIEILQPEVVWQGADAVLLEFIERQYRADGDADRRSTGLFTDAPGAPHGVVWRHLQETWVDRR